MPKVFSHRGSLEDDFPEVQSFWNVKNNFPRKLYGNVSVPLSLLRHLLVTQMKEEEGGMETTTVPQQHAVCLPIAFPFRVVLALLNLHFWSGMLCEGMWQTTSGEDAFCWNYLCLMGCQRSNLWKQPSCELVVSHVMAECSCASWFRCFRQTWWMSADMLVIRDSTGVLTFGKTGVCVEIRV